MGRQTRVRRSRKLAIGIGTVALASQAACIPYSGTQFREAAIPAVQTGMSSIMNGLLDGLFAAIEVEKQTDE